MKIPHLVIASFLLAAPAISPAQSSPTHPDVPYDTTVPLAHAEVLDQKFKAIDGDCELFLVENGQHNVAGGNGEGVNEHAEAFLKTHLRAK